MYMRFPQAAGLPLASRRSVWRGAAVVTVLAALLVTAGCTTRRVSGPAPVEDRGLIRPATAAVLPGAENAGKPGYYTVKPGDTLFRIGNGLFKWVSGVNVPLSHSGGVGLREIAVVLGPWASLLVLNLASAFILLVVAAWDHRSD